MTHIDQVLPQTEEHGRFGFKRKRLWTAVGGQQLACAWYELSPGKQASPHHFHSSCEEAVFVLEGTGAARIGEERIAIAAGDYISFPPGPGTVHSIINTSNSPLRYLCFSTVAASDIVVYPDSKKVAFSAGVDPSKDPADQAPWIARIIRDQPSVDYYEGEE